MHASLGQDARLPDWEESGVDTTGHHILGLNEGLRVTGVGLGASGIDVA